MIPTVGQTLQTELAGTTLKVNRRLGEGAQGIVYEVVGTDGPLALKWYHAKYATAEQRETIRDLITRGQPLGRAGSRFAWPRDLAPAASGDGFGYLMELVDTSRFYELWTEPVPADYPTCCEASVQLADSFRALHLQGLCYRDINRGNVLFDPRSGDIRLLDNDNVGVDRHSRSRVAGTMGFMAPEVVRGDALPSTVTDQHSLAVWLFLLWIYHHPLHGLLYDQYRVWDPPAQREVYGRDPVFTHDPNDRRNQLPADADYETARKRWQDCPAVVRALFLHAFTVGLHDPNRRVTEGQWRQTFQQLRDTALECPRCKAQNLWDQTQSDQSCWNKSCRTPLPILPRLRLDWPTFHYRVFLRPHGDLLRRQVEPRCPEESWLEVVGRVVQNPNDPRVWGLRNLTPMAWSATFADGSQQIIGPQKAAPLSPGLRLRIGSTDAVLEV